MISEGSIRLFRLGIQGKRSRLEVKGKVLSGLEDQLLPVPKEGRKRLNPLGGREAKERSQGPGVRN